jgi:hypothetical protein
VEPSAGGADQEAINMLVADGMPYSKAVAVVRANKQQASAGLQARIDAAAAERAPAPAPVAPEEETVSPETIRQYGYMPQAEPGPSSVRGGGKVTPGQQFTKMSEAIGYMTRTPVTDANREQAYPDAAYMPSQRDIDMAERGFFPVYADDGSVSYSVGTGREAQYQQDVGRGGIPGGLGRLGPRADLEETDPSQPGFTLSPVRGPTGTNYIYKQNQAAQDQQAAYMDERQLYRMAKAAGMSPAEFAAQNEGAFGAIASNPMAKARMMVQAKRQSDEVARLERWKSQMMLAGGRPTGGPGGTRAVVSALDSLPDDQRNSSLRYMLPGGQLAAAVDGRTNEQLAELGLRTATGRGFQQPDPRLIDGQVDELRRRKREADPVEAGREDLAAGKATSPLAMKEADRLAEQYDSGDEGVWWLGGRDGMSDTDEANLAGALVRDYGMDETLARDTARRAADRRRWYRKRGPMAPAAPTGKAPPPAGR